MPVNDSAANVRQRLAYPVLRLIVGLVLVALGLSSCSATGDEPGPPDATIDITAGTLSTSARHDGTTEVPFVEVIFVDVTFEEQVIGSGGQTSVYVEADPIAYRVEPRQPRDWNTYSFALRNPSPGTATVRVYKDRDTPPITFEIRIGLNDE